MLDAVWRRIQAGRHYDDILSRAMKKELLNMQKKIHIPIRKPLQAGRTYLTRDGNEVILRDNNNHFSLNAGYIFESGGNTYLPDGAVLNWGENPADLVDEVISFSEWSSLFQDAIGETIDEPPAISIQVGHSYENRIGEIVTIRGKMSCGNFEDTGGGKYSNTGKFWVHATSVFDLIKEVTVDSKPPVGVLSILGSTGGVTRGNAATPPPPPVSDPVNHPSHYTTGKMEAIDLIEIALTAVEFRGMLIGNILKYILRFKHKNGVEDLKKARWYLTRLIDEQEEVK